MDRSVGTAIYTPLLNARGTYESDITVHRLGAEAYRLFVGTGAIRRDLSWLERHSDRFDVALRDVTEAYAVLGLMGPEAGRIAAALGAGAGPVHIQMRSCSSRMGRRVSDMARGGLRSG